MEDTRSRAVIGLLADELRELAAHVGYLNTLVTQRFAGVGVDPAEHRQLNEELEAMVSRLARISREFPPPVSLVIPPPDEPSPPDE